MTAPEKRHSCGSLGFLQRVKSKRSNGVVLTDAIYYATAMGRCCISNHTGALKTGLGEINRDLLEPDVGPADSSQLTTRFSSEAASGSR